MLEFVDILISLGILGVVGYQVWKPTSKKSSFTPTPHLPQEAPLAVAKRGRELLRARLEARNGRQN